jgi:hypothetical protein
MSQTLQEKNKALLLEGFDVLFNKSFCRMRQRHLSIPWDICSVD